MSSDIEIGVPVSGAWVSDVNVHFQPNADGSITYTGRSKMEELEEARELVKSLEKELGLCDNT